MAQRRMRIGVVGANDGTDRWGARAHLPAIAAAVVRSSATGHWEVVA